MALNSLFSSGAVLTATQMNNLPFGIVDYKRLESLNQTGITTVTDITGASITFTAVANRRYMIFAHGYHNTTAADVVVNQLLREGSTTFSQSTASSIIASIGTFCQSFWIGTFSAGSHTIKVSCQLQSGTGTISAEGAPTYPYIFAILDMGTA